MLADFWTKAFPNSKRTTFRVWELTYVCWPWHSFTWFLWFCMCQRSIWLLWRGRPKAITRQVLITPACAVSSLALSEFQQEQRQCQKEAVDRWGRNPFLYSACFNNSLNKEMRDLFLFPIFFHCNGTVKIYTVQILAYMSIRGPLLIFEELFFSGDAFLPLSSPTR